jgi:hypothetical protein
MIALIKIAQLLLIVWVVTRVLSIFRRRRSSRKPRKHPESRPARFDTAGKNISDGEYKEL